jgi:hypothetical protein
MEVETASRVGGCCKTSTLLSAQNDQQGQGDESGNGGGQQLDSINPDESSSCFKNDFGWPTWTSSAFPSRASSTSRTSSLSPSAILSSCSTSRKSAPNIKLEARRVIIMETGRTASPNNSILSRRACPLTLASWLSSRNAGASSTQRFPLLNTSRDTVQQNNILRAIKKPLAKKSLDMQRTWTTSSSCLLLLLRRSELVPAPAKPQRRSART